MGTSGILGMLFNNDGDSKGIEKALQAVSRQLQAELIPSLTEAGVGAGSIARRLDYELVPSFQRSGEAAKGFGEAIGNAFLRATDASQVALAAEGARLTATLGYRRVAAGMEAAWETAKGIASLAEWDFRSAALHFMSAAEYGIIAGSHAGRRISAAGSGYGNREPRFLGPTGRETGNRESGAGSREGRGGTTVVFNVSGHLITGPETAEWLAGQLTDYVQNRDGVLMSSHTKDSTLARDSLNG